MPARESAVGSEDILMVTLRRRETQAKTIKTGNWGPRWDGLDDIIVTKNYGQCEGAGMKRAKILQVTAAVMMALAGLAGAQKEGVASILTAAELQRVMPQSFFYAGQSAPVQLRNAAGIRSAEGKFFLAALVDASGYSSSIAEKYQGFLISETRFWLDGSQLPAGAYGFGTLADGNFVVSDIGGNELLRTPVNMDKTMRRPVPLKIAKAEGNYQLYLGRKTVAINFPAPK